MNIAQIEENVKSLLSDLVESRIDQENFIYELLLAYGHRKQSVTRLRSGERNMASKSNESLHDKVIWKRHLYFKQIKGSSLYDEIDQMRKEKLVATNKIRFVIVTNFDQLLAVDTKTSNPLDINLDELPKQFDFFLPWAGMEKAVYQGENPADLKAAEKMAKLFDLIKGDNFDESNREDTEALHRVNVFLTRLLFCFFAEDTEIFSVNQFSLAVQSHTKDDGSDLSDYLNRLFTVLNAADSDRGELPDYLSNFPYVNGSLFADDIPSPVFSAKSRRMLIECGSELDWSDINPDIFGSMIQAVVHPDQRGGMGMHYTSVTNIMKVIEPLFLNDLYEELAKVENTATKLQKLQQRLGEIKIFDPACGSGNFLIIAYKELRKLEMEVLKRLQELELEKTGQISQPFSVIKLSQFYGIELDDFAHEVAILSLWLAEHQLNVEFKAEFGDCLPSLPLNKSGNVYSGNATLMSWRETCPNDSGEVFILGNPPYMGAKRQSKDQKSDMASVFEGSKTYKNLDYISCWVYKASEYISMYGARAGLVTTNSITQGDQVDLLWPSIFDMGVEISFAYTSFKWANSAKGQAAVICVIVGLGVESSDEKYLFHDGLKMKSDQIGPYLNLGSKVVVKKSKKSISSLPEMAYGNMPLEGGFLKLSDAEKLSLLDVSPEAASLIRPVIGGEEFLKGIKRWCLWIDDENLDFAMTIPEVKRRIEGVKNFRINGGDVARTLVDRPHQFRYRRESIDSAIVVPCTSSERREYMQCGFYSKEYITMNSVQVVYDASPFVFGILSSRLHMLWVKAVAGRLKSDYRYSNVICYNTFPVPEINSSLSNEISMAGLNILSVREEYSDIKIGDMYIPDKMPAKLLAAHLDLDRIVETIYSETPFNNDDERVSSLLKMYEKMTGGQSA